ncbi:MAG: hypothetical protein KC618_05660, partial [Candidatus Omnitrophica bacterium]|nr:hypothetical protein [Candidatus Omnitrophota bacterium]
GKLFASFKQGIWMISFMFSFHFVIPAKAGIQFNKNRLLQSILMDPRLRGDDIKYTVILSTQTP